MDNAHVAQLLSDEPRRRPSVRKGRPRAGGRSPRPRRRLCVASPLHATPPGRSATKRHPNRTAMRSSGSSRKPDAASRSPRWSSSPPASGLSRWPRWLQRIDRASTGAPQKPDPRARTSRTTPRPAHLGAPRKPDTEFHNSSTPSSNESNDARRPARHGAPQKPETSERLITRLPMERDWRQRLVSCPMTIS